MLEPIRGEYRGFLRDPRVFTNSIRHTISVWIMLGLIYQEHFFHHQFVKPHIRVLNPWISAFELPSSLFLFVFFDSLVRISLRGEVNLPAHG